MANPPVREPPEIPPPTPGRPTVLPIERPAGNPRPEVPPPIDDPARPPLPPQELPGRPPDEMPVRGSSGPQTPYAVNDPGIADQSGSQPDLIPRFLSEPRTISLFIVET